MITADLLRRWPLNTGETLGDLSTRVPTMLVFLRHFGCAYCREATSDLSQQRAELERRGMQLAFVHVGDEPSAQKFFSKYNVADVPRLADPEGQLYDEFGLQRGSVNQLLGPRTWGRMISVIARGHASLSAQGDVKRMPGVFVVHNGRVLAEFRHETAADRPDYLALADLALERMRADASAAAQQQQHPGGVPVAAGAH